MTKLLPVLALAFVLVGCKDRGACLETEQVLLYQTIPVGNSFMLVPHFVGHCVRYEFPEGRPQ